VDVTLVPAIVTGGMIQGGNRGNIIPDSVVLEGTVSTFDEGMRKDIKERIKRTAEGIAQGSGATAAVTFVGADIPVTINDPALTERMLPTLKRVTDVSVGPLSTPAEDFSLFGQKIPALFVFLGITPKDQDPATVPRNHSPYFFADEAALPVGVKAMTYLAADYLGMSTR